MANISHALCRGNPLFYLERLFEKLRELMMHIELRNYPLVVLDECIHAENHAGRFSQGLIKVLNENNMAVLIAQSAEDCFATIALSTNLSGVLIAWDDFQHFDDKFELFLSQIKLINASLPIFVFTQSHELRDASLRMLNHDVNFFWKYGDTYDFMVGRIKKIVSDYLISLLPPFFKQLKKYTEQYNYAWHTPGHMGGVAFLKSPVGRMFYDFYGENMFRSDLSISVPELGSLLEHSGVNGEAERFAARVFGSDHTFFVTNGTSTANKMVMMSCATKGDVALIDRNCHKSLQHALTMSDVIPIYLKPTRNAYGIIGTIPLSEFTPERIAEKIRACPLIEDKSIVPKMVVITNSTYDGLIYHVGMIQDQLALSAIPNVHFDEAWFAYAHFHPIYHGRYAMSSLHREGHPTVFSTQSTHKLLAAFSQASMLHVKVGKRAFDANIFNETYMMHTSTSPQYAVVASLDVASKMMEGQFGHRIINDAIMEAIEFRQKFSRIRERFQASNDWFFDLWQPDSVLKIEPSHIGQTENIQTEDDNLWILNQRDSWHGFETEDPNFIMLDPIKVTLLTPGIRLDGSFEETGIPGPILSRYLIKDGAVDEKTSFYSLLFLFSIGVNKSNSMNLLNSLLLFKNHYDQDILVEEIFPQLFAVHPDAYNGVGLKALCHRMHQFLKREHATSLIMQAFDILPQPVITPNQAYQHIVKEQCEAYPIDELKNKVILTMLAPYPPGIPIVMPGEKITKASQVIIDYLSMLERFDNAFPGFENEVHGVEVKKIRGKRRYFVNCLQKR